MQWRLRWLMLVRISGLPASFRFNCATQLDHEIVRYVVTFCSVTVSAAWDAVIYAVSTFCVFFPGCMLRIYAYPFFPIKMPITSNYRSI